MKSNLILLIYGAKSFPDFRQKLTKSAIVGGCYVQFGDHPIAVLHQLHLSKLELVMITAY